jgi:subfamily B ATP-binding cassette protein MsbA
MYLCASLKDLKEIIKYTFVYKGIAILVVVCNLLFVIFNLLSLVLFIPVLQLIFRAPADLDIPAYPSAPNSLLEFGTFLKEFYQFQMAS